MNRPESPRPDDPFAELSRDERVRVLTGFWAIGILATAVLAWTNWDVLLPLLPRLLAVPVAIALAWLASRFVSRRPLAFFILALNLTNSIFLPPAFHFRLWLVPSILMLLLVTSIWRFQERRASRGSRKKPARAQTVHSLHDGDLDDMPSAQSPG